MEESHGYRNLLCYDKHHYIGCMENINEHMLCLGKFPFVLCYHKLLLYQVAEICGQRVNKVVF